jgi:hypothetical protein
MSQHPEIVEPEKAVGITALLGPEKVGEVRLVDSGGVQQRP